MKITQELKTLKEILTIFLNKNAILSSLDYRGPRGLFSLQEKMPSHHSRRINRLINGQRSAADPRPEPRFCGNILVVAPAIALTFRYGAGA